MTRVIALLVLVGAGCYTSSTPPPAAPAVAEDPPPKKKRPPPAEVGSCDEVSCVLSSYEGACCARYKPKRPAAPQTHLDRHQIQHAITGVRSQISACASSGVRGTVKVSVKVAPDGSIASAVIMSPLDPALDACVLAAIGLAVFPPTDAGGSFAYPFVF